MTYRDWFETCPRCGTALEDSGVMRACSECRGQWLTEGVVHEMVIEMLPAQPLTRLELAVVQRAGERLACPTCKDAMSPTTIHGVELDHCAKHGIWFDAGELQTALQRVADPERRPPLQPLAETHSPWGTASSVRFELVVRAPGKPVQPIEISRELVKIGTVATSDVRLDDPQASRMHAIIDASQPDRVTLIDLGSRAGTFVNAQPITNVVLHSGDRIGIGDTSIDVRILPPTERDSE